MKSKGHRRYQQYIRTQSHNCDLSSVQQTLPQQQHSEESANQIKKLIEKSNNRINNKEVIIDELDQDIQFHPQDQLFMLKQQQMAIESQNSLLKFGKQKPKFPSSQSNKYLCSIPETEGSSQEPVKSHTHNNSGQQSWQSTKSFFNFRPIHHKSNSCNFGNISSVFQNQPRTKKQILIENLRSLQEQINYEEEQEQQNNPQQRLKTESEDGKIHINFNYFTNIYDKNVQQFSGPPQLAQLQDIPSQFYPNNQTLRQTMFQPYQQQQQQTQTLQQQQQQQVQQQQQQQQFQPQQQTYGQQQFMQYIQKHQFPQSQTIQKFQKYHQNQQKHHFLTGCFVNKPQNLNDTSDQKIFDLEQQIQMYKQKAHNLEKKNQQLQFELYKKK